MSDWNRERSMALCFKVKCLDRNHWSLACREGRSIDCRNVPCHCPCHGERVCKADVTLFKPDGKYFIGEQWRIPESAVFPADMRYSPDFRRIGNGAVLVNVQEPWGYPHLLP